MAVPLASSCRRLNILFIKQSTDCKQSSNCKQSSSGETNKASVSAGLIEIFVDALERSLLAVAHGGQQEGPIRLHHHQGDGFLDHHLVRQGHLVHLDPIVAQGT